MSDTAGERGAPHCRRGVAAGVRDRPVTSVAAVTGGAAARRSAATVLTDPDQPQDPRPEVEGAPGDRAAEPPPAEAADDGATTRVVTFSPRPPIPAPVEVPAEEPAPAAGDSPAGGSSPAEDPSSALEDDAAPRPKRRRARRGPNKRELRYQQTREAIVDAATELFDERGFDAVSVQQIAARAGVVEKTVFNHFPVKEGLVFEADPPIRAALLDAVARRRSGESVSAAAGTFVVAAICQLGSPAAAEGVTAMARVIRGSRTLQTREREILGTLTDALAREIAAETGAAPGDLEPWLAANAVLGLYASLLELARDRVLAGDSGPALVDELRHRGQRGLALLQFGLAGYAKRR